MAFMTYPSYQPMRCPQLSLSKKTIDTTTYGSQLAMFDSPSRRLS
jgi:hypothetical protein